MCLVTIDIFKRTVLQHVDAFILHKLYELWAQKHLFFKFFSTITPKQIQTEAPTYDDKTFLRVLPKHEIFTYNETRIMLKTYLNKNFICIFVDFYRWRNLYRKMDCEREED